MLGSLRFRLPAFFLLGVVIAGLVATVISIRFFQSYTRTRTIHELRSESIGIVALYASQAGAQEVPVATLRKAIGGDRIFYVPVVPGASLFAGPLPHLPVGTLTRAQLYDSANSVLQQQLSQVEGVGQITLGGSALPSAPTMASR